MRNINEMMLMISGFLFGAIAAKDFYGQYEERFLDVQEEIRSENDAVENLLSDIAYECAFYDAHDTQNAHLYDESVLKKKVADIYSRIIPLALFEKVS